MKVRKQDSISAVTRQINIFPGSGSPGIEQLAWQHCALTMLLRLQHTLQPWKRLLGGREQDSCPSVWGCPFSPSAMEHLRHVRPRGRNLGPGTAASLRNPQVTTQVGSENSAHSGAIEEGQGVAGTQRKTLCPSWAFTKGFLEETVLLLKK